MVKTLYVGNLPWQTSEEELAAHFSPCGKVNSVHIVLDRETGRSRGFAFVEMEKAEEAAKLLDGKELGGRTLKINIAREREFKPRTSDYHSRDNF
jgi:RNA recognition motif-containing protein